MIGTKLPERASHGHVAGVGRPFGVPHHGAPAAVDQRLEAGWAQVKVTAAAVGPIEVNASVAAVHDGDEIGVVGRDVGVAAGGIVLAIHLAGAGVEHADEGVRELTYRAGAVGGKGEAVLQGSRINPLPGFRLVDLEAVDESGLADRIARIQPFAARSRVAPGPLREAFAQDAAVRAVPVHAKHLHLPVRHRAVDHPATARRNERVVDLALGDQLALAFLSRVERHDRTADATLDPALVGLPLLVSQPYDPRLGTGECQHLRRNARRGLDIGFRLLRDRVGRGQQQRKQQAACNIRQAAELHSHFVLISQCVVHKLQSLLRGGPIRIASTHPASSRRRACRWRRAANVRFCRTPRPRASTCPWGTRRWRSGLCRPPATHRCAGRLGSL